MGDVGNIHGMKGPLINVKVAQDMQRDETLEHEKNDTMQPVDVENYRGPTVKEGMGVVEAPICGKDGLMKITHVEKDTTTWKRRACAGQVFSKESYAQAVGEKRKKEVVGNGGVQGDQGKKGKRRGCM
jgi:hypothetical protein